jgi:hypothetical protein
LRVKLAELPPPPALQRFIDDELLRAPMLADQVLEGALDHLRKGMATLSPLERGDAAELMHSAQARRAQVASHYLDSLRQQALGTAHPTAAAAPKLRLALVDEAEVAVDVALSHAIETVRALAESELRELQTYVAALAGDMEVSRDHNPFKPEVHARAWWAALQALPLPQAQKLNLLRHGSTALAEVLRKAYSGACARLDMQGVTPASHRTVILPAGPRRQRSHAAQRSLAESTPFRTDFQRLRASLPAADQAATTPPPGGFAANSPQAEGPPPGPARAARVPAQPPAPTAVDTQWIELLSHLFDALLADRQLAADVKLLVSRLQSPLLRTALHERDTLEREQHPAWRFIDQIAFLGDVLGSPGDPARAQVLRFAQGLVEHVLGEPEQNAQLYEWALNRLTQHETHSFQRRARAAAGQVAQLQALEDQLLAHQPGPTMPGEWQAATLEISQMDTVPAALLEAAAPAQAPGQAEAWRWLQAARPGGWWRLFLDGQWVQAQLIWPGERGELWLLADGASDTTWALRRKALITLRCEGLLQDLAPRSLMREAAKRVMRKLARPAG